MNKEKYQLRYLPIFYTDLEKTITYITNKLNNPRAANKLLNDVEQSILHRQPVAEAFQAYYSSHKRLHPYYRIYVNNFTVLYVVLTDDNGNKIMEVRRFLYNKCDTDNIL